MIYDLVKASRSYRGYDHSYKFTECMGKNKPGKMMVRILGICLSAVLLSGTFAGTMPVLAATSVKKETSAKTAAAASGSPEVWIHQQYEYKYDEIDGESKMVYDVNYAELKLTDASAEAYPELKHALDRYNQARVRLADHTIEDILSQIDEMKKEGYPFYDAFADKEKICLRRVDEDVVSFVRVTDWYGGGAHGYSGWYGTSFDAKAGTEIMLSDLIPAKNNRKLKQSLIKKLREAYDDPDREYEIWFDLEGTMDHYSVEADPDAEVNLDEENYQYAYNWVLDPQGVTFFFNPYELAAYAYGGQQVTILFDEYPELFSDSFSAAEKGFVLNFRPYEDLRFDRDGLGDIDTLRVTDIQNEESYQNGSYDGLQIELNGKVFEDRSWETYIYDFDPMLVRTMDGSCWLYVLCQEENDWEVTYIYDLNGRTPRLVGTADAVEQGFDIPYSEKYSGSLFGQVTDPASFRIGTRAEVLSTLFVTKRAHTGMDGKPVPDDKRWKTTSDFTLTLKKATSFDCVDDKGRLTGKTCGVSKGEKLILRYTDGETYCDAETEDGTMVRIFQDKDPENGWPYTVNGFELNELFEHVVFAG